MLPKDKFLNKKIQKVISSSKNHKMIFKKDEINGFCDELEAMNQVIYKILNTERYKYNIYSWNYGVELLDLFGKDINYVCIELEKRVKEALIVDNRILDVVNFTFDLSKKSVIVAKFDVITIFGKILTVKEVDF